MGGRMRGPREAVDKVIRRPWTGELHHALAHHGAGGGELILVALNIFAINQMRDVENHLAALGQAAADFFIEWHKEPVHLETNCTCPGLALSCTGRALPQAAQVLSANPFRGQMLFKVLGTAVIDEDLQVHLGLAAQFLDIALKLALVGTNRLAEDFVVIEDCPETEGKHRRVLETICNDPGVIDAGLLIQCLLWIVLADDNCEVAGWIKKYLVAANSVDGFQGNGLAMTG